METFPLAPAFPRPMGTGTIIQHFISSLRWVRYSLSVDDNAWLASSHYPMGMRKCANTLGSWPCVCHAGINHLSPQRAASTAENEPSRAAGLLQCSLTPHCFFLSLLEENKRWTLDSQRHMRSHNCPSLSITAGLGQLNKYLKCLLPGTWVSSRDVAVSSKNVVFLNKLDRLLWTC